MKLNPEIAIFAQILPQNHNFFTWFFKQFGKNSIYQKCKKLDLKFAKNSIFQEILSNLVVILGQNIQIFT